MLRGIIGWSLQYRFLVLVVAAGMLFFGGPLLDSISVIWRTCMCRRPHEVRGYRRPSRLQHVWLCM